MHVFDLRLQLSPVSAGELTAEDDGDLIRLADGAVGIQQPLAQCIECRPAAENQVVAVFDLGEESPVLAPGPFAFLFLEERRECSQPLAFSREQIARDE
jgi:hypothetical protein